MNNKILQIKNFMTFGIFVLLYFEKKILWYLIVVQRGNFIFNSNIKLSLKYINTIFTMLINFYFSKYIE